VVVRRGAAVRQPGEREHGEAVVGLLVQQVDAEACFSSASYIRFSSQAAFDSAARERAHGPQDLPLVRALRADPPQVGDELRDGVGLDVHRLLLAASLL
jgi:hypothetical protein